MNVKQEHCDALAKVFAAGRDDDDWEGYYLDPNTDGLVATLDNLAHFREHAKQWREASELQEIDGGLYWDAVQVAKGQQRVSLAVIDCGEFRLTYKQ